MKSMARRAVVMSRGSFPIRTGAMRLRMAATVPLCVSPDHRAEMVASPALERHAHRDGLDIGDLHDGPAEADVACSIQLLQPLADVATRWTA
jgi:hypothetical protein